MLGTVEHAEIIVVRRCCDQRMFQSGESTTFGAGTIQSGQGQTNICDCVIFNISKIFSASLAVMRFCNCSR